MGSRGRALDPMLRSWRFVLGAGILSVIGLVALVRWLDAHPFNQRVRQAW